MAGGAYNLKGGIDIRRHKANRSNLEQAENESNAERKVENGNVPVKFPMHVHKPGGLVKNVENEDDLSAALAKGWYEDIRQVPVDEPTEDPTSISEMTLAQGAKALKGATAAELAAFEADEASHGNRPKMIALIEEAKDNLGADKPKKPAAAKKPAATKKGK